MQDWPPQSHFQDHFLELFDSFMDAVPFGDVSRLDGVLNLASHFPINGVAPDLGAYQPSYELFLTRSLGPKMYIAYRSVEDDYHQGSTKLHIDVTDAINIMVWSSDCQEPRDRYALWRIFPWTSSSLVCEFLRNRAGHAFDGHPIHSQSAYFTDSMLRELDAQLGVRLFTTVSECMVATMGF
jgi:lysine-specific demethylase 3